jgi:hypothetical protein
VDQSNLDQLGPKSGRHWGHCGSCRTAPPEAPLRPTLRTGATKELGRGERWPFGANSAGCVRARRNAAKRAVVSRTFGRRILRLQR